MEATGTIEASSTTEGLSQALAHLDSQAAARLLEKAGPKEAAGALRLGGAKAAGVIMALLDPAVKKAVDEALPPEVRAQWALNLSFPKGSVGRLLDPAWAVFPPETTARAATDALRDMVKREFITYAWVAGGDKKLLGVVVMRDLLFAAPDRPLSEIMIRNPFSLKAATPLMDAMREVLNRHFPVYPVTSPAGELLGTVRGGRLFEAQAIEISAQAGSMVGVEKEEKLSTPWARSFRYRHPWLQLNLLTAFVAGAVVNLFQATIDQVVILAAFLPVLAGQSGNTGCQALAVTIRGITLRELKKGSTHKLLIKESLLGLLNGALVGVVAGGGMYFLARSQGNPLAFKLGLIVVAAMTGSCVISGLFGAVVPITLRRLGADPATASSIFLTTATDVASMGLLLGLASWFLV
ncbi:MAG TPA: magnesium transporter [Elusimicrobia bacterium]|nr:MAG: magnesium transporter [Elusimicrobia bacterium GWD2_63_28]HCC47841.1 magnesium transporter [Elusimicrobiota bacterium]